MKENPTEKDLKQFKLILLLFPILPAIILCVKHHYVAAGIVIGVFWCILLITLIVSLVFKKFDRVMYKLCRLFLNFLGTIIAGIALIFTWVLTIFPTGLLARALKRDRLSLKKQDTASYWKPAKKSEPTYENQY
ncbi:MAG: hypothetical protein K6C94_02455 [Candidatus Gastranaerophilales bacterium]|nr:hypothetical protein [Candidatus Gastranaerophilales bacterium]